MIQPVLNHADCLDWAIRSPEHQGSVDLIYLDPPFMTGRDWGAFDDRWASMDSYIAWMRERIEALRDLLAPTGSLYLHCDPTASHYLKIMLDHVFGRDHFQGEFVWYYGGGGASRKRWARKHDVLLYYSRGEEWTFNTDAVREPYRWTGDQKRADGSPMNPNGKIADDVWIYHGLVPWAQERTGYPTQKPVALLERIIKASSNPGDTVLDPMCGSGTTLVAAKRLGRHTIGIDKSADALQIAQQRLNQEPDTLF